MIDFGQDYVMMDSCRGHLGKIYYLVTDNKDLYFYKEDQETNFTVGNIGPKKSANEYRIETTWHNSSDGRIYVVAIDDQYSSIDGGSTWINQAVGS